MLQSIAVFAVLAVLAAVPARAHHSAAAEFDASKLLVLTGIVTKVEWTNPHVHIHLDVKPAKGAAVDWYLEMASPNGMRGLGWLPYTMKRGDVLTVAGIVSRADQRRSGRAGAAGSEPGEVGQLGIWAERHLFYRLGEGSGRALVVCRFRRLPHSAGIRKFP